MTAKLKTQKAFIPGVLAGRNGNAAGAIRSPVNHKITAQVFLHPNPACKVTVIGIGKGGQADTEVGVVKTAIIEIIGAVTIEHRQHGTVKGPGL